MECPPCNPFVWHRLGSSLHRITGWICFDSQARFSEESVQQIVYQLLLAVYYLHSAAIVHQDLKPTSILIGEGSIKVLCKLISQLCSFGYARSLLSEGAYNPGPSKNYWAPEMVYMNNMGAELLKGCDMWAIGCILGELLLSSPLFTSGQTLNLLREIFDVQDCRPMDLSVALQAKWPILSNYDQQLKDPPASTLEGRCLQVGQVSDECLNLLRQLLVFDYNKRLSVKMALEHSFFARLYTKSDIKTFPKPSTVADDQLDGFLSDDLVGALW